MPLRAVDLVASMVLDNGHRWGECAEPEQWADMRALLEPGDGPRRHFWLRSRGRSKTTDAGAATLGEMLAGGIRSGDEMYAAAAGKDQAALLARKIQAIARATPELAGAVEIQQNRVITPSTGAVLDVMSSELATSWGKTPRWVFIDEICNHDNTGAKREFVLSLLTSLIKRPDSTCLIGSTPSSVTHWAYEEWQHAVTSGLWRASILAGPAPWQDPRELEDERARLAEFEWLRLFECRWAAADDSVADEQALDDATRETPAVPPQPGCEYVVAWDIGWRKDHSAVTVCHMGERGGRKALICDRLESWVPAAGREVRISDVLTFAADMSRAYNGAMLTGDPHEAWQTVQDLRARGYHVKPADTGAAANSVRAKLLLRLVRDRALEIPADTQLRRELLSLRLAEGTTPGVVRLTSDGSAKGHHDRVMALMYAGGEILNRPGMSWRSYAADTIQCQACSRWHLARLPECTWCHARTPGAEPGTGGADTGPFTPQPGGYLAAMLGGDARRCEHGHIYAAEHGTRCPKCTGSTGTGGLVLPAAFTRALAITPSRR